MMNLSQVEMVEVANKSVSSVFAVGTGVATVLEFLPGIMGALASLAGIVWLSIQAYYFIKEKKAKGE